MNNNKESGYTIITNENNKEIIGYKFLHIGGTTEFSINFNEKTISKKTENGKIVFYNNVDVVNNIKIAPIKILDNFNEINIIKNFKKYFNILKNKDTLDIYFNNIDLSKYNIVNIQETIPIIPTSQDGNKMILKIDNIDKNNQTLSCQYISTKYGSFTLKSKDNSLNSFKFKNTKDEKGNRITNDFERIKLRNNVINHLIEKSRTNGDFGLESSLINGKLVLLNSQHNNNNVHIILMGWTSETAEKDYNNAIIKVNHIQNGLILMPFFDKGHVSTIILEKSNNETINAAFFDSSTDHLFTDKNSITNDTLRNTLSNALPANINIKILNQEDLQTETLTNDEKAIYSKEYNLQSPQSIKLGNCGYYTLKFIEYIANNGNYATIKDITNNIEDIKINIQEELKKELKYKDPKVFAQFLQNRKSQGIHGDEQDLDGTEQHTVDLTHELNHGIIASKFQCFNNAFQQSKILSLDNIPTSNKSNISKMTK